MKDNRDEMELILEHAKLETKDEKDRANGMEQKVVVAYEKIQKNAQMVELTMIEKIDQIV
jgi:hypothetical protein